MKASKNTSKKWDVAYAAIAGARPKFHYSLHLQAQIQKYRRHIDCFVGERKHRVFKSIVAPRLSRLGCFSRSTLLQLTEIELTTSHPESEYSGRLVGKSTHDWGCLISLSLPKAFKSIVWSTHAVPLCKSQPSAASKLSVAFCRTILFL